MAPFVPLQDKYVRARALACCPTMDLVAALTSDRHLVVHVSLLSRAKPFIPS